MEGHMLNNRGFDLWADDYDKSVGLSDEGGTYPFAGYKDILIKIYNSVLSRSGKVDFLNMLMTLLNDDGYILFLMNYKNTTLKWNLTRFPIVPESCI